MSSQSSYVTNENPNGLGLMAIRQTDPMVYNDRMILQPVDRYSSGGSGSTAIKEPTVIRPVIETVSIPKPISEPTPSVLPKPKPVVQPVITTTSVPKTGGSFPIVNPVSKPAADNETAPKSSEGSRSSFVRVDGDDLIINGTRRIPKKQAAIIGGGAIGAALLLKYIL